MSDYDQPKDESISTINGYNSRLDNVNQNDQILDNSTISHKNIPQLSKILVTYDGEDKSNQVFNYAIALSNYSGSELSFLRILEYYEDIDDLAVKGSASEGEDENIDTRKDENTNAQVMNRKIQAKVIDDMERKIKECKAAGCKNEISYKFRAGNVIDEISNEVKDGNYDLVILRSSNIDSWVKSLFSDTRKIMSHINVPVLLL
ncbi:universal stress protein [Candidatus Nitrosocosmicus hydrocola]|uniref:universal stress protein n=1 Tax=Candidatus Nitrosocosmicus hydrocola TaxID=1826872 RepID=UPI0011E5B505|nr:universal stress protein [Candidatus Nitrosocosmicus hydrocola]